MIVGAVAEMATLGAVVPFLALLSNPALVVNHPLLSQSLEWFGIDTSNILFFSAVLFGFVALSSGLIRMLLMWFSLRITYGVGADIGGEVYRRTLYQKYSWHLSKNSSEIIAAIDKVNIVVGGVISPLAQGAVSLMLSLGIFAMLIAIDSQTALVAGAGFFVLYVITTRLLRRRLSDNSKTMAVNSTWRVQAVQEGLGGIREVLLDGTQSVFYQRFAVVDARLRRAEAVNNFVGSAPRYVIEAVGMVLIVALAYWLSDRQGGLTGAIPVLGALAIGAQKLLPQMQQVYNSWSSINGSRNQLEDVLELLDRPIPAECAEQGLDFRSMNDCDSSPKGENVPLIALRNISFSYQIQSPRVLQDNSLEIYKGNRIGVIGATGSGKSTFIDLIMGLLEPTSGLIEIDGKKLKDYGRRRWQSRIAHVPQVIFLADNSIAENIAFGVPFSQIDHARVRAAASKAQLTEFIEALPEQYQTSVGERGVRLSGGQRQRIGLARALYKQADVLVLDEATSALDDVTEQSVMDAINLLGSEMTVLMIAHRVTTLRNCNMVIKLLQNGTAQITSFDEIFKNYESNSASSGNGVLTP